MLRKIRGYDRGAAVLEYAAVIVLVVAIAAALLQLGLPQQVTSSVSGAVDRVLGSEDTHGPVADAPSDPTQEQSGEFGEAGTQEQSGEAGGSTGAEPLGLGKPGEVDTAYLDSHTAYGFTPADNDGSWFGAGPMFKFEDRGNYNWDCGWLLDAACKIGGGTYQGAREITDGARGLACHVHLCSHENFNETWEQTKKGWKKITSQPVTDTLGDMWDGFVKPIKENAENNSGAGGFFKNLGYAVPAAVGGVLKPLKFLAAPGSSSGGKPPDGSGGKDSGSAQQKGAGCPPNSFLPGTLVLAAGGQTTAIEDVDVGDRVRAADPTTGETGVRRVTHLIRGRGDKTLVDITVAGHGGKVGTLTATARHRFWAPERGRWITAEALRPGTRLRTASGTRAYVSSVEVRTAPGQRVHNLTVAGLHTYHVTVGGLSVLVHNEDPYCGKPFGGSNDDGRGGEDFHGQDISLDEIVGLVSGHTDNTNPTRRRPTEEQIEETLRKAPPEPKPGQNATEFNYKETRVIVNWEMPWKSTAYYPER
ncbi:polymorphic toxin-type HINT domain-containing protein [Streptomonospora litoralis]|uniref:Hint domain-containing protein n=1 Tax=Streptomonospora litoralis TaxID=2498135 RepID=A0A4P6Q0N5_9ACTN|nr:polymorphic toxin-type HINT domain-containing protein [Streptomonospora litoralis]QBI53993.1 hypothetical protein EKD16_11040 [Streptomonospora litoralis]